MYTQNNKLHGWANEAHLGNRAEEDWLQAWGWEQRHDPVHCSKRCKASASIAELTCKTKQISKCNLQITFLSLVAFRINLGSFWIAFGVFARFPCLPVSPRPAGLLQGMCIRQSAGGARAEVHGWEKCGHSADGIGRSFPPAHPRAPTAVQLQLNGRHAGHLRRGWIPTVRQGLQGERRGHRSRIYWSQGKTWLFQQRLCLCL